MNKISRNYIMVLIFLVLFILFTYEHFSRENKLYSKPDPSIKQKFEHIYANGIWQPKTINLESGGGSGPGSRVSITIEARNIIYHIFKKYNLKSMIDAPCGSMSWVNYILYNLTNEISDFRYYGVDVVESIVNASKLRYENMAKQWKIEVLDFTSQELPDNYDLIFTRDALMHLPYEKALDGLKNFANTKNAKYLLAGSFLGNKKNHHISIGDYYPINLLEYPFNLKGYAEIYDEKYDGKSLILYDIPNYLSKIDFDKIKSSLNLESKQ